MNHRTSGARSVSAQEFLEWETQEREALPVKVDAGALRRFRQVVRRSAETWLRRPATRLCAVRTFDGCGLQFEFQVQGDWVACFTLSAHHEDGLFTLKGPAPARKRIALPPEVLGRLNDLYRLWRTWDESEGLGQLTVTVYLHSWTPGRVEKYAKTAAEMAVPLHARSVGKTSRKPAKKRKLPSGKPNEAKVERAAGKKPKKATKRKTKQKARDGKSSRSSRPRGAR